LKINVIFKIFSFSKKSNKQTNTKY